MSVAVCCVKAGSAYGPRYVNALYEGVRRHTSLAHRFICFTDDATGIDPGVECRPLPAEGLEGWWNKLSLFKRGIFEPGERVVYFDLDTIICGPIDGLLSYRGQLAVLRDFYKPDGIGSGVMLWHAGDHADIWLDWCAAGHPMVGGGDQGWLEQKIPSAHRLQDIYPGRFASFKKDCGAGLPFASSVLCLA